MSSSSDDSNSHKRKLCWKPDFPFQADYNDHFETPLEAYKDVLPLLDLLHPDRSCHRLYDPYYCNGQTRILLGKLGFTDIIHDCRDFYQDIQNNTIVDFHTLITNPPYSDTHKERCLEFAITQLNQHQRPFFLLMPNYIAAKNYYRRIVQHDSNMLYLLPSSRYLYEHPEGTGHASSPFESIWYCGLGKEKVQEALALWKKRDAGGPRLVTYQELIELKAIPTAKRPNPRQRRKKRRKLDTETAAAAASKERDFRESSNDNAVPKDSASPRTKKKHNKSRYRDRDGTRTKKRF